MVIQSTKIITGVIIVGKCSGRGRTSLGNEEGMIVT